MLGFSSARALGATGTGDISLKPACATAPWGRRSPGFAAAMFPNPALATAPCAPREPPEPLPLPAPAGRSNPPRLATVSAPFFSDEPFTPLTSPKPPVCTSWGGLREVTGAELPTKAAATTSFLGGAGTAAAAFCWKAPTTTSFFNSGLGGSGGWRASKVLGRSSILGGSILGSGTGTGRLEMTSVGRRTSGGASRAKILGGGATMVTAGGVGGTYRGVTWETILGSK